MSTDARVTQLGRVPSRLPADNLAAAFAPTERTAGLSGRLAPYRADGAERGPSESQARRAPDPKAGTPTDVTPPAGDRPGDPSATRGAPRRAPQVRENEEQLELGGVESPARTIVVYLPVSLRDQLRGTARQADITYTALVLDAIEATYPRLGDLLAPHRPTPAGNLFTRATPRPRRHTEPHVQVSLRPMRDDLDVIDRLVDQLQAPSRSELIAAALTAHLQHERDVVG